MEMTTKNLECRMYEAIYPEVHTAVMIQVKNVADRAAYVSLLEYNNIRGMIRLSELCRHRIRSISSLIKVGQQEPVMILRVVKRKGYIELSNCRVSEEDIQVCKERYNKSKLVHSIMRHVAVTLNIGLTKLYVNIGWPLYRKYGHAFEAFKVMVAEPDTVLVGLKGVTPEMKDALVKNIRRIMTPQPSKIRAYIEMKCFQFDGVEHIKDSIRKAEAAGTEDCPVKIKLVVPPLYVLTTQTLDKEQGITVLANSIKICTESIVSHQGNLTVKEAPRALSSIFVSERDDKLHAELIAKHNHQNKKVDGDDGSEEEEEDTGMGDVDLDKQGGLTE